MTILREKCKISSCGLLDLQLANFDIKINSEICEVCQK
jgi:hypothetical protein